MQSVKLYFVLFLGILLSISCSYHVYLFSPFHEPADEGLRFLYSYDGYNWEALNKSYLEPELGSHKIMRDPSIIRDKHGTYHLVWPIAWRGDKVIGYASSKDLIHCENKKILPVIEH